MTNGRTASGSVSLERTTPDFPGGPWRASWIWADGAPAAQRHVVALTAELVLDEVPDTVPARWCAVSRAVVYVNGVEVGRGPIRSNPRRQPYEVTDLAPHLTPGTNRIAVLALTYAGATPWYLPMPPFATDLANGAFVLEADLGDRWFVTDEAWSGSVLDGWGSTPAAGVSGRGIETIDARSLGSEWATDGVTGAAVVRRAHAVGEPGRSTPPSYPIGPFGARPISDLTTRPVELAAVDDTAWSTDRIAAGTLLVEVDGPAGGEVTIRVAEESIDGRPTPTEHDAAVRIVCDGTRRVVESLDRYGGQGALVAADDGVTVHAVSIVERLYPAGAHRFACSDAALETIHAVGRRSVSLNSTDAYTDCPTREQRAWTGDFVVHQLVDLTTSDDWLLARHNVRLIADSRRPDGMLPMAVAGDAEAVDFTIIPDWALHWVHAVWNLYRYVGDRHEIAELLPVVEGVVRWFEPFTDDTGLVRDVYGWVIIDWSAVDTRGASSALNGLLARALLEFAEMADWLGDAGRASWARARHDRLRAGFEAFWDAGRGRYVDSIVGRTATDAGEQRTASEHGQAAAIVGGVVPAERIGRLVDVLQAPERRVWATWSAPGRDAVPNSSLDVGGAYLREGHPEPWWDVDGLVVAQPFFSYVVHDALAAAGRADLIGERCKRWEAALERCPTSWTETWFGGTISHGWSSTPTRDLVQHVAGVTPARPGFAMASIEPALGDLGWVDASVPTPHGPIEVRAEPSRVVVDSPVPFVHHGTDYPPGRHTIEASS
ncbi:MAG: alpha-L-rhamnosidase C-terminal domain-containing protein [Ilumatobacter fluminis]|uniref:alpha-L-rhamnosidase-related protein n=1 Tax=Ilumatobacter fluminis TaxID=467091 RepID=UPI0032F09911